MNRSQAIAQVTDVAVWARERATYLGGPICSDDRWRSWTDLADAADDLAAMLELDTFAADRG